MDLKSVSKNLEDMLLDVLVNINKIDANQSFIVSDEFIEKISRCDGKVVINNFQNQSISVDNRKQIVAAIKILRGLNGNSKLLPRKEEEGLLIEHQNGLYKQIVDEIDRLGGFSAFKENVFRETTKALDNNKTHAADFLGVSVKTLRTATK